MENQNIPGVGRQVFELTLTKALKAESTLQSYKYVMGCDPYMVEEPLNVWHKILAKMGIKHKTKCVGYSYTLIEVDGKLICEYKGRI